MLRVPSRSNGLATELKLPGCSAGRQCGARLLARGGQRCQRTAVPQRIAGQPSPEFELGAAGFAIDPSRWNVGYTPADVDGLGHYFYVDFKAAGAFQSHALTGKVLSDPRSAGKSQRDALSSYAQKWCMTNINIDERLLSQARRLTRLRTKRESVQRALELLVETETRKDILRYRGSGIWRGDLKAMRRNRL